MLPAAAPKSVMVAVPPASVEKKMKSLPWPWPPVMVAKPLPATSESAPVPPIRVELP